MGIEVQNKTLDQLYTELKPELDKKSGETCYARFDENKGLRIKDGITNRLFGNTDVRGKKFSDAAEVFKQAIDTQYPGEMVGDLTLGESMLQSVIGDCTDGERISAPQIERLYQQTHAYADERGLESASSRLDVQSSLAESKVVQSNASVETGKALLWDALRTTLAAHPRFDSLADILAQERESGEPQTMGRLSRELDQRVRAIMDKVDTSKGLTLSAIEDIEAELANAEPPMEASGELLDLIDVVELRDKIETTNREFVRLNAKLDAVMAPFGDDFRNQLQEAVDERRNILSELRGLRFPGEFNDPEEWENFADRLQSNVDRFVGLMGEVDRSPEPLKFEVMSHLSRQVTETFALAEALRIGSGDIDATESLQSNDNAKGGVNPLSSLFGRDALNDAWQSMKDARGEVPKSLWKAPTRYENTSLQSLSAAYDGHLQESQDVIRQCFSPHSRVGKDEAVQSLSEALAANDRMLEAFKTVRAIRGDSALSGQDEKNSLSALQTQRHYLNLQLACLRTIQREVPQQAQEVANPSAGVAPNQRDDASFDDSLGGAAFGGTNQTEHRRLNMRDRSPNINEQSTDFSRETSVNPGGPVWSLLNEDLGIHDDGTRGDSLGGAAAASFEDSEMTLRGVSLGSRQDAIGGDFDRRRPSGLDDLSPTAIDNDLQDTDWLNGALTPEVGVKQKVEIDADADADNDEATVIVRSDADPLEPSWEDDISVDGDDSEAEESLSSTRSDLP